LTISAPSWLSKGKYEVVEESENSESEFPVAIHKLKYNIGIWLGSVNEDFKESLFPSAIFLGKVWSRIFFSLQNAAEDLKRDSDFFKIMEIYALCIINAFLIEEAEHHLDNLDSNSKPDEVAIDRSNPRTSAPKFVDKLAVLKHCRNRFPFTSIIVTCPLILGLLDSNHAYASVLDKFFRKQTTQDEIKELLCHKAAVEHLQKVAISGTSSQRSDPTTK
jgi:hypothetical protein